MYPSFRDLQDEILKQKGEMAYKLTGITVGVTNLFCYATKISGAELTSTPNEVQVRSCSTSNACAVIKISVDKSGQKFEALTLRSSIIAP